MARPESLVPRVPKPAQKPGRGDAPIRLTLYSDALYFGGAEGYLALLARYLDPGAFEITLIAPEEEGSKLLCDRIREAGGSVHHLPRPGFRWMQALPEMTRVLRRIGGDVLHINLPSSYDAGLSSVAWAARRAGYRRVVSTEHLPMVARKYKRFPVKFLFSPSIDQVIVVAEATRRILSRRHGIDSERIVVVPNGVPEPAPMAAEERSVLRASWGCRPSDLLLGITGQLTRRKGHHVLLRALAGALLARKAAPLRLVVTGGGEEEGALRALSAELGLSERITWLGRRDDAARLMRALDLFVLPSEIEAMPLTILEAMAAGLPVLSTSIFGIPEVVVEGETGRLVRPNDPEELARALLRITSDRAALEAMGAAGRRRFEERFTVERMVRETAHVYRGETRPEIAGVPVRESHSTETVPA